MITNEEDEIPFHFFRFVIEMNNRKSRGEPSETESCYIHTPAPTMDAWEGAAYIVTGSPLNPATLTRSYSPTTYVT
jgi:hypothetical protein